MIFFSFPPEFCQFLVHLFFIFLFTEKHLCKILPLFNRISTIKYRAHRYIPMLSILSDAMVKWFNWWRWFRSDCSCPFESHSVIQTIKYWDWMQSEIYFPSIENILVNCRYLWLPGTLIPDLCFYVDRSVVVIYNQSCDDQWPVRFTEERPKRTVDKTNSVPSSWKSIYLA